MKLMDTIKKLNTIQAVLIFCPSSSCCLLYHLVSQLCFRRKKQYHTYQKEDAIF